MKQRLPAFTLIEVLVVAAIMSIVIGGGIAGFIGFNDRQVGLNAAQELNQLFRTAQTKAGVGAIPSVDSSGVAFTCTRLLSYSVVYGDGSNPTVRLRVHCDNSLPPDNDSNDPIDANRIIRSSQLTGVTISSSPTLLSHTLYFYTLQGGTNIPVSPGNLEVTVKTDTTPPHVFPFKISRNGAVSNLAVE